VIADLNAIVGDDRLVYLPQSATNVHQAAAHVRQRLQDTLRIERTIKGVVLLGDYATVPSWKMVSTSVQGPNDAPPPPDRAFDEDLCWVWSDDLYGDRNGDRLAELPVSRVPITPNDGWLVGDRFLSLPEAVAVFGVRSHEFAFADCMFKLIESGAMEMAPPASADTVGVNDLEARRLYLVLHGKPNIKTLFRSKGGGEVVNYDLLASHAPTRGVVFAGVCWGALIANKARAVARGESLDSRQTPDLAIALAFLEFGVSAFIGFTALHHLPNNADDAALGSPLHALFWQHVVNGEPPALALFNARHLYLDAVPSTLGESKVIAKHMKAYWSATCLGLGW
ncbi:MAG: hypothetical protein WKF63_07165, partial [Thermomicrobiales bacterium]